jgi:hypothetical protein
MVPLVPLYFTKVTELPWHSSVCVEAQAVEARHVRGITRRFLDLAPSAFGPPDTRCIGATRPDRFSPELPRLKWPYVANRPSRLALAAIIFFAPSPAASLALGAIDGNR